MAALMAGALAITLGAMSAPMPVAAVDAPVGAAALGTTWELQGNAFSQSWRSVAHGNGTFVALSSEGNQSAGDRNMTSTDGANWRRDASTGVVQGKSVAFGDDTFIAVRDDGPVYASTDGVNWIDWNEPATSRKWSSVTYGNGYFVAVNWFSPSLGKHSGRSLDGVTWSMTNLGEGNWRSVAFGDDTFVAVEDLGASKRVAYSTDNGDTWSLTPAPSNGAWTSVTYGAGVFVAVGDGLVMTSPDGVTWTLGTPAENNYWWSVTYAAGMFVAVAAAGNANRVMTSPDGITWTARAAPERAWRSVTYGNGGFVAVGDSGVVMTSGITTGLTPTLDTPVYTVDGFTVNVTNYDAAYTWTPTVSAGSVSVGAASGATLPVTVSGLSASAAATMTMTTSRFAYTNGSATASRPLPSSQTVTWTPTETQYALPAATVTTTPGATTSGDGAITYAVTADTGANCSVDTNTGALSYSAVGTCDVTATAQATINYLAGSTSVTFTISADPSPPRPAIPAGAPLDVRAMAGDAFTALSWSPPESEGSWPITHYQAVTQPRGASCLVPADSFSCTLEGLANGTEYEVRVRGLTGAGWGSWSEVVAVTPQAPAESILISGSRDGRSVHVRGVMTGMDSATVTPWVRFPGPHPYQPGSGVRTVRRDGTFSWQRVTAKKMYVYFRTDDGVRSNRVIIPAR